VKKTIDLVSRDQLDAVLLDLRNAVEEGSHEIVVRKKVKRRTLSQNSSLHRYTELIAIKMNDAGITQKELVGSFKEGFELPVTDHMIKDIIREVGKAMFLRESTADLLTTEMQEVYRIVDQRLGEVSGVRCEWPAT